MNEYESVIIIKPNITKAEESRVISNIKNKISELAKITKQEDIGTKKLAYEIKKFKEGHYLLFEFEVVKQEAVNVIQNLEQFYRITDEIIKYIIVRT